MQLMRAEIHDKTLKALVDDGGQLVVVVVNLGREHGRTEDADGGLILASAGVDPADDWRLEAEKVAKGPKRKR